VGLAVKRDAQDLATALSGALEQLARDGRLRQIFAKQHVTWQAA
jgi:ABC-type amino acid transport substrate-binding protein